jgi:hypothetical protein
MAVASRQARAKRERGRKSLKGKKETIVEDSDTNTLFWREWREAAAAAELNVVISIKEK